MIQSAARTRTRIMPCLLGVLFALVIADGYISQFLVMNNLGIEGNPLLVTLVNNDEFLYLKILGALLSVFILWDIYRRRKKLAISVSTVFVFIYTIILYWNIGVFITQSVC